MAGNPARSSTFSTLSNKRKRERELHIQLEIMYQYSPLTMGWCINCHRETNVQVESNEYYAKIHDELSKKYGVDKLTAAQMGGLECGKCHY